MAALTALLSVGAAVPEACDRGQRPFQLCVRVKTYPWVCGRRPGVPGLSLCAPMPLHFLAHTAPLLRASRFFLIGMHQFGPSAALALNAGAVRRLSTLSSSAPVNAVTHPASSISPQLAVQQLPGSLAPFHLCYSCRPVELCTASRNVLWYVETSGLFFLFFLLLTSK